MLEKGGLKHIMPEKHLVCKGPSAVVGIHFIFLQMQQLASNIYVKQCHVFQQIRDFPSNCIQLVLVAGSPLNTYKFQQCLTSQCVGHNSLYIFLINDLPDVVTIILFLMIQMPICLSCVMRTWINCSNVQLLWWNRRTDG